MNSIATLCFALAILHTFSVSTFQRIAAKHPEGSFLENLYHLLGEVEIVFGLWGAIYLICLWLGKGQETALSYLNGLRFTEPAFVFVIMAVCSCRPILKLANGLIEFASKLLPLSRPLAFYLSTLILGPLLGSLITEPAAMTVTALILLERFYSKSAMNKNLMYATLGLLFVNVSIGGTLTTFAAPPVLMVASKWGWDLSFMLTHFGWKALLAIMGATGAVAFVFRKQISTTPWDRKSEEGSEIPFWVYLIHLMILIAIVMSSHHIVVFAGVFFFFLGLVNATQEYQTELKIREALLVAFFLAGLVVLGEPQKWWLEPLLSRIGDAELFLGAMALTALTDNAALTFLGAQVTGLSDTSKYALVAGAVTGGGLTVIANAPNPAGYGILNSSFGEGGIHPGKLLLGAIFPTTLAAICFWLL